MNSRVVHCKKEKFDVLVDRTTPFGNPFIIGVDGDRGQVINKHIDWLSEWIINGREIVIRGFSNKWVTDHLHELKNKVLGCWCVEKDCHGETLAELAESLVIATEHKWYECNCGECYFCRSELSCCEVCGGFEGTLTTHCCGRKLTPDEERKIYNLGTLDFRDGQWVEKPNFTRVNGELFICTDGIQRTKEEYIEWGKHNDL